MKAVEGIESFFPLEVFNTMKQTDLEICVPWDTQGKSRLLHTKDRVIEDQQKNFYHTLET